VQVAGVERGGRRTLTPGAGDSIKAGDNLLVLGTPKQIQDFRDWLGQPPGGEQPQAGPGLVESGKD
jgi:Trk K+ transport system NAD-binding subunit